MNRTGYPDSALRKAIWTETAERDLARIYDYLLGRTRVGTRAVVEGILSAVQRLEEFPEIGARAEQTEPIGDLRQFPWRQYLIFYRIRVDGLIIVRVWDSHRDPESLRIPQDAAPVREGE